MTHLLEVLKQYKDTHSGRFIQGIEGASELYGHGLLEWHGSQYGCHFYSITEKGQQELNNARLD